MIEAVELSVVEKAGGVPMAAPEEKGPIQPNPESLRGKLLRLLLKQEQVERAQSKAILDEEEAKELNEQVVALVTEDILLQHQNQFFVVAVLPSGDGGSAEVEFRRMDKA